MDNEQRFGHFILPTTKLSTNLFIKLLIWMIYTRKIILNLFKYMLKTFYYLQINKVDNTHYHFPTYLSKRQF